MLNYTTDDIIEHYQKIFLNTNLFGMVKLFWIVFVERHLSQIFLDWLYESISDDEFCLVEIQ